MPNNIMAAKGIEVRVRLEGSGGEAFQSVGWFRGSSLESVHGVIAAALKLPPGVTLVATDSASGDVVALGDGLPPGLELTIRAVDSFAHASDGGGGGGGRGGGGGGGGGGGRGGSTVGSEQRQKRSSTFRGQVANSRCRQAAAPSPPTALSFASFVQLPRARGGFAPSSDPIGPGAAPRAPPRPAAVSAVAPRFFGWSGCRRTSRTSARGWRGCAPRSRPSASLSPSSP